MDTDVEVVKPLDEFLKDKAFSGYESNNSIPTGIMASEKHGAWVAELLKDYDNKAFVNPDGSLNTETNVILITNTTKRMYPDMVLNNELTDLGEVVFYPKDYFCPIDLVTNKLKKTNNTHAIHWFNSSWFTPKQKFKKNVRKFLNIITFGGWGKLRNRNKK